MKSDLEQYAPLYVPPAWSPEARGIITPFVTSVDAPVYSFRTHMLPPQLLGALFSRASRAKGDLREILWNEYFQPILFPSEQTTENLALAQELYEIIKFHNAHPNPPYNTKRAYQFFAKWLAQYGDDSIAQMTSTNLVAAGLSQPALKFLEDQRVGVSPIEKSTRYVDYGNRIEGHFLYYTDPHLAEWDLEKEYGETMNTLFEIYRAQIPVLTEKLATLFPEEKHSVLEKKAFDVMRDFLPMATLSQVAFHGNAQAFKYMIDRCACHPMGELRWFACVAREALDQEIPALLLRLDDNVTKEYQQELSARKERVAQLAKEQLIAPRARDTDDHRPRVRLVEYDTDGESKIIAGLLYAQSNSSLSWDDILGQVRSWTTDQRERILKAHLEKRTARWQKVGRAFENTFVRFEITMKIGAYRDLHRHRMHTQDRQLFTTSIGYDATGEVKEFKLETLLHDTMKRVHALYQKVEARDPFVAQYVPAFFHFVRFYQYQNLRQFFWETELRTISQGRADYRWIEQEKYRLLQKVYPLLAKYILIDMNQYELARRGTEEKMVAKEQDLAQRLKTQESA